jgi:hypothetical protein
MGMAAVREEFDEVVAALPSLALTPSAGQKDSKAILRQLEGARLTLQSDLATWRDRMLEFKRSVRRSIAQTTLLGMREWSPIPLCAFMARPLNLTSTPLSKCATG